MDASTSERERPYAVSTTTGASLSRDGLNSTGCYVPPSEGGFSNFSQSYSVIGGEDASALESLDGRQNFSDHSLYSPESGACIFPTPKDAVTCAYGYRNAAEVLLDFCRKAPFFEDACTSISTLSSCRSTLLAFPVDVLALLNSAERSEASQLGPNTTDREIRNIFRSRSMLSQHSDSTTRSGCLQRQQAVWTQRLLQALGDPVPVRRGLSRASTVAFGQEVNSVSGKGDDATSNPATPGTASVNRRASRTATMTSVGSSVRPESARSRHPSMLSFRTISSMRSLRSIPSALESLRMRSKPQGRAQEQLQCLLEGSTDRLQWLRETLQSPTAPPEAIGDLLSGHKHLAARHHLYCCYEICCDLCNYSLCKVFPEGLFAGDSRRYKWLAHAFQDGKLTHSPVPASEAAREQPACSVLDSPHASMIPDAMAVPESPSSIWAVPAVPSASLPLSPLEKPLPETGLVFRMDKKLSEWRAERALSAFSAAWMVELIKAVGTREDGLQTAEGTHFLDGHATSPEAMPTSRVLLHKLFAARLPHLASKLLRSTHQPKKTMTSAARQTPIRQQPTERMSKSSRRAGAGRARSTKVQVGFHCRSARRIANVSSQVQAVADRLCLRVSITTPRLVHPPLHACAHCVGEPLQNASRLEQQMQEGQAPEPNRHMEVGTDGQPAKSHASQSVAKALRPVDGAVTGLSMENFLLPDDTLLPVLSLLELLDAQSNPSKGAKPSISAGTFDAALSATVGPVEGALLKALVCHYTGFVAAVHDLTTNAFGPVEEQGAEEGAPVLSTHCWTEERTLLLEAAPYLIVEGVIRYLCSIALPQPEREKQNQIMLQQRIVRVLRQVTEVNQPQAKQQADDDWLDPEQANLFGARWGDFSPTTPSFQPLRRRSSAILAQSVLDAAQCAAVSKQEQTRLVLLAKAKNRKLLAEALLRIGGELSFLITGMDQRGLLMERQNKRELDTYGRWKRREEQLSRLRMANIEAMNAMTGNGQSGGVASRRASLGASTLLCMANLRRNTVSSMSKMNRTPSLTPAMLNADHIDQVVGHDDQEAVAKVLLRSWDQSSLPRRDSASALADALNTRSESKGALVVSESNPDGNRAESVRARATFKGMCDSPRRGEAGPSNIKGHSRAVHFHLEKPIAAAPPAHVVTSLTEQKELKSLQQSMLQLERVRRGTHAKGQAESSANKKAEWEHVLGEDFRSRKSFTRQGVLFDRHLSENDSRTLREAIWEHQRESECGAAPLKGSRGGSFSPASSAVPSAGRRDEGFTQLCKVRQGGEADALLASFQALGPLTNRPLKPSSSANISTSSLATAASVLKEIPPLKDIVYQHFAECDAFLLPMCTHEVGLRGEVTPVVKLASVTESVVGVEEARPVEQLREVWEKTVMRRAALADNKSTPLMPQPPRGVCGGRYGDGGKLDARRTIQRGVFDVNQKSPLTRLWSTFVAEENAASNTGESPRTASLQEPPSPRFRMLSASTARSLPMTPTCARGSTGRMASRVPRPPSLLPAKSVVIDWTL